MVVLTNLYCHGSAPNEGLGEGNGSQRQQTAVATLNQRCEAGARKRAAHVDRSPVDESNSEDLDAGVSLERVEAFQAVINALNSLSPPESQGYPENKC